MMNNIIIFLGISNQTKYLDSFLVCHEIRHSAPALNERNHIRDTGVWTHFRSHRQFAPRIPIGLAMRSLERYRRFSLYRVATHQTGLVGQTETGVVQIAFVRGKYLGNMPLKIIHYYDCTRRSPGPPSGPC